MCSIEFINNPDIAKYAIILSITGWCLWRELTKTERKGQEGERKTKRTIRKLRQDSYHGINDVLVRHPNSQCTSQIDHIIVSTHGIFVIETKNYSGIIIGTETDKYWEQRVGRRHFSFLNPIHQNNGHIRALRKILSEYGNIPYISIIAFSNKATLRVSAETVKVVKQKDLLNAINSYKEEVISADTVRELFTTIQEQDINCKGERNNHIRRIKETIKQDSHIQGRSVCSNCGSMLIPKTGPFGRFLGCSNYPTCTYTRAINLDSDNNCSADLHYRSIPENITKISA